jgi:hypothetical protein
LSSVEERKADRLRIMNEIYSVTGGNTREFVSLWPLRDRLGIADRQMASVVSFLEGEGLIECRSVKTDDMTPLRAAITHRGVKEMERSEKNPEQPTEHFPPQTEITINIGGDMIGSAIQSNSAGATQHVEVGDIAIGVDVDAQIHELLDKFEAKLSELRQEQAPEAMAELVADITTVRAQMESPKPKKNFIVECLGSIKAVLENGAGGVVTTGLLALLGAIHL